MDRVRIGCVEYLNTLPLIEGLGAWRDAELVAAVPAKLADLLTGGQIDVGLVSLLDAARSAAGMTLLPVGMIGCDGPTLTVRVFSSVPMERVTRVWADTDSHTSTALMQVVLWEKFGRRVEVVGFDARERAAPGRDTSAIRQLGAQAGEGHWPETVLLIGDKVVTDAPPAERYPHQLDLGQAWKEQTGLPFVYAVWMCRAGEEDSVGVQTCAAMLDRARRHNGTRMDWLVASRAAERGWSRDLAGRYVGSLLRYEVGRAEREAIARFLSAAKGLGLVERAEVRWAWEE